MVQVGERKLMRLVGFLSLIWGLVAAMLVIGDPGVPPGGSWQPASLSRLTQIAIPLWIVTSTFTKTKLAFTGCYSRLGKVLGVASCFLLAFIIGAVGVMEFSGPPAVWHPASVVFGLVWFVGWFFIDILSILSD